MKYRFRSAGELSAFTRNFQVLYLGLISEEGVVEALAYASGCAPEALVDPQTHHPVFPYYPQAYAPEALRRHAAAVLRPLLRVFGVNANQDEPGYRDLEGAYMAALAETDMPEAVIEARRRGWLPDFSLAGELEDWIQRLAGMSVAELGAGLLAPYGLDATPVDPRPLPAPEAAIAEIPEAGQRFMKLYARAQLDAAQAAGYAVALPCHMDADGLLSFSPLDEGVNGAFVAVHLGPRSAEVFMPIEDGAISAAVEYLADPEFPTFDALGPQNGVPPAGFSSQEPPPRIRFETPEDYEQLLAAVAEGVRAAELAASITTLRNACARALGYADARDLRRSYSDAGLPLAELEAMARLDLLDRIANALLLTLSKQHGRLSADAERALLLPLIQALRLPVPGVDDAKTAVTAPTFVWPEQSRLH